MQEHVQVDVIQAHDVDFRRKVDETTEKNRILIIYTLDNIDHYLDRLKYVQDSYDRYLICTGGPYKHPKNIVSLDSLIEVQDLNKDIEVNHNKSKPFDFLLLPGKNQIWRLELVQELLQNDLLDNSLWSLINKPGTIVDIKEKLLPREYELEGFELQHMINNPGPLNRKILPTQYENTRCSVVCETTITEDRIYLTEKTWKPLIAGHPFVTQGNPGLLEYLNQLGFRTYESVWNEDYQNVKEIADICRTIKSINEKEFIHMTEEINLHNRSHARNSKWIVQFHEQQIRSKLLPML